MSTADQVATSYDYLDRFYRLCFGPHAELSSAFYDGDFSMTLQEAQHAKHQYVLDNLHITKGSRVLDIGCGYGAILNAVRERGGQGIGVSLAPKQVASCRAEGLEVYLRDWKTMDVDTFGAFDGVASLGAFEHFCSTDEYRAGRQERIYDDFFKLCHAVLPERGRLFLQTMIWGENAPSADEISLKADKDSNAYIVAVLDKNYPGSWLPMSLEQIVEVARPYFKLISSNNGRKDYIETMTQIDNGLYQFSFAKLAALLKMIPQYLSSRDFRYQIECVTAKKGYLRESFVRQIMEHERIVFEKV